MSEIPYDKIPYDSVRIFKGEGRFLIIPYIEHMSGAHVEGEKVINVEDSVDSVELGKLILKVKEYILKAPVSRRLPKELLSNWETNSKYKSEKAFWKNNNYGWVDIKENGECEIYTVVKSEKPFTNPQDIIKEIKTKEDAEEIGKAVIDVFNASEEFYKNYVPPKKKTTKEIELLEGEKLIFKLPKEKDWKDMEDESAAEIYQAYECENAYGELTAMMNFGIAAELDCDVREENIKKVWESFNEKAKEFEYKKEENGIFKIRAEFKNKNVHKLSYILNHGDNDILECTIEVYQPNRRKKLDEKLVKQFQEIVLSCKLEQK
jgi:hypothetical protein